MLKELTVRNNENLVRHILIYNNIKDLSNTCQVNKTFKRSSENLQNYWREETNKIFSSNYEHYNIINPQNLAEINEGDLYTNWKLMMKRAFQIQQSWLIKNDDKITNNKEYDVTNEIEKVKTEFYTSLQFFIGLPELRKTNIYVENELNSKLQIYFLDDIFNSQDLYDFYDQIFENQFENKIEVRNKELPFAKYLEDYFSVKEFISNQGMNLISKIRWYEYSDLLITNIQRNDIISVMLNIYKTINHFCIFSYNYIKKYRFNETAFLNEYSKRYRHFIDVATHLNEYCENLNVLVNYLYEDLFNIKHTPKFSILRIFLKMWHKEVLYSLEKEEGLISKMSNVFKKYIKNDINHLANSKQFPDDYERRSSEYMIEQFNQHLLDMSCHEYNVFYLNSTEIKISYGYYLKWEQEVLSIIENNINNLKNIQVQVIQEYIRNNKMINSFIAKTKKQIIIRFINSIINQRRVEVIHQFKAFSLKKNSITLKDAETHFKIFGDLVEESEEKILDILINIISDIKLIAKYKAILFINESKKNNNLSFLNFIELSLLISTIQGEFENQNHLVNNENKQRNIKLDHTKLFEQLYSITYDFRLQELYNDESMSEYLSSKIFNPELDLKLKSMINKDYLLTYRSD